VVAQPSVDPRVAAMYAPRPADPGDQAYGFTSQASLYFRAISGPNFTNWPGSVTRPLEQPYQPPGPLLAASHFDLRHPFQYPRSGS
jgi:hypothetical protein